MRVITSFFKLEFPKSFPLSNISLKFKEEEG